MGGTLVLIRDAYTRYLTDVKVEGSGLALLVYLRFQIQSTPLMIISVYIPPPRHQGWP